VDQAGLAALAESCTGELHLAAHHGRAVHARSGRLGLVRLLITAIR
jgi:hypothetical protein